jgi:hypothetical protein
MAYAGLYFTKCMMSEIFMAVNIHIKFIGFLKRISVITDTFKVRDTVVLGRLNPMAEREGDKKKCKIE